MSGPGGTSLTPHGGIDWLAPGNTALAPRGGGRLARARGDYRYLEDVVRIRYPVRDARAYLNRHLGNKVHYELVEARRGEEVGGGGASTDAVGCSCGGSVAAVDCSCSAAAGCCSSSCLFF